MASDPPNERRLAAILMADVVGYSRLMGQDEAATVAAIAEAREVFADYAARARGRIVNAPGDSVLAEFASVVDAVAAAVEIQRELAERNAGQPPSRAMHFRIGINLGDVIVREDAIYGDGVNVAARLETLAEPGGICLSRSAHDQVKGKLPVEFEYLGEHEVKNIAEPVRAYRVLSKPGAAAHRVVGARRALAGRWRRAALVAGVAILLAGVGLGAWRAWGPAGDAYEASSIAGLPTIAVLPFANLSGDPEQEYFADGITEDLITLLAQFRDLAVIARNSTFTYKGRAVDVRTVGEEMGADFVLEGSVRRSADRIRVTAQLLDASDGKHLWAETYDRELTAGDVFDLQDELTDEVATAIAGGYGALSTSQIRTLNRKPPEQLRSYECVMRAYEYLRTLSPQQHFIARDCLEQAVRDDPHYAPAWAWLVWIYISEYALNYNPRPDSLDRAGAAVQRAVALDSTYPQTAIMEAAYLYFRKDPAFVRKARAALAANPKDFFAHGFMGVYLCWAGQWAEGLAVLERGEALSPVLPGWYHLPRSHRAFLDGNGEQALENGRKYGLPGFFWYHIALATSYVVLGNEAAARAEGDKILSAYPGFEPNAYAEFRKWFWEEDVIEEFIAGLRAAGLNIPPDPAER